jgi:hypothetical protein
MKSFMLQYSKSLITWTENSLQGRAIPFDIALNTITLAILSAQLDV